MESRACNLSRVYIGALWTWRFYCTGLDPLHGKPTAILCCAARLMVDLLSEPSGAFRQ